MGKSQQLLSKSTFIRSLQCRKSLYLYKYHKHLQDKISDSQQALFNRGHQVGALARLLFKGGIDVGWKSPLQYNRSVALTQKQIENGATILYEAAFIYNNTLVAADILVKKDNAWYVYEVKSATKVSETYIRDAALQYLVIKGTGLQVAGFNIIHINRDYIRGDKPSVPDLFTIVDVTAKVIAMEGFITENLALAANTLSEEEVPAIEIGPHCLSPYPCDFRGHCWGQADKGSIFNLSSLEEDRKWTLFNKGIKQVSEIPDDYPMTLPQKGQYESLRNDAVVINRPEIKKIIEKVRYPAAFVHLSICRPSVPLFKGTSPYQAFPFGYGLLRMPHVAADYQEEALLVENGPMLLQEFVHRFLEDTKELNGIVVYGHQSELTVLKSMISYFPELRTELEDRISKMLALTEVFDKRLFNHPGMSYIEYPWEAATALGLDMDHGNAIIHHEQAAQVFSALFYEKDFLKIAEARNTLMKNQRKQSSMVLEIYKMLREETLSIH